MTREPDSLRRDAARYVEGGLDGEALAAAHGRLHDDPAFADEVRAMRKLVEVLEEVPAEGWRAIPAAPRRGRHSARRAHRSLVGLAVIGAAAVGLVAGIALAPAGSSSDLSISDARAAVVLHALPGADRTDRAIAYMLAPGRMLLRVMHLRPTRSGDYYELWLMTDRRRLAPVAAFRTGAGGRTELTLMLPDDPRRYVYLDVSLQHIGAGTAHSGDSVMRATLR